jgi:hypothetical protein
LVGDQLLLAGQRQALEVVPPVDLVETPTPEPVRTQDLG